MTQTRWRRSRTHWRWRRCVIAAIFRIPIPRPIRPRFRRVGLPNGSVAPADRTSASTDTRSPRPGTSTTSDASTVRRYRRLCLQTGTPPMILGFSTQWSSPAPQRPFRYGGAARPAELAPEIADALAAAVQRLAALVPLVGLNSVDFLVEAPAFHLVEINPRPGATIDIFELQANGSLFALHVAACRGTLPAKTPCCEGAAAGAIVYAADDIAAMPSCDWPDWTADRPIAGSSISAQSPFCTVFASATTAAQAKELVDRRSQAILARLRARPS